jgi:polygalacturonase
MTAISDIEFSPGTVITSAWLNGVNDSLNNVVSGITGSTARTLTNKALDLVSIKDYGVIGDGSTDDTSAINTALSLFANTNKYLFMPAGTYKVSSTITIPNKTGLIANGDAILYATSAGFSNTVPTTHYTSTSLVVSMDGQTSSPYTPNYNQKLIGVKIEYQFVEGRVVDAISNRNCYNSEIDHCEIYNYWLSYSHVINLQHQ